MEPLFRRTYRAAELMERHPPRWQHPHKKLAATLTCPEGAVHTGEITVTRWAALPLPEMIPDHRTAVEVCPYFYSYEPSSVGDWHVNFADRNLFGYYGGPLLAQDELQVLEHPALGAVREALLIEKLPALTVEGELPTPVLVLSVERRGALDTTELYGNRFARATPEKVRAALRVLDPPTTSNILAMEAIPGGHGAYTREELEYTLQTAFTGFCAARTESLGPVTIHTGFWGCGAYGGNRTVMVLLQLLAAQLAGMEKIVLYSGDLPGLAQVHKTLETRHALFRQSVAQTLDALHAEGFGWGVSDGN
jgi:hypothetical protein